MLPSLVVDEVRRGVAETLRAQFEPSTALFKDAVRRLIDEPTCVNRGRTTELLAGISRVLAKNRELYRRLA